MPEGTLNVWRGKAGQIRVGHWIQGSKRTAKDVWEATEFRNPGQIEYGHTLWMKVANVHTGVEAVVPPKVVTFPTNFLLTDEEFVQAEASRRPPHRPDQWPTDSDEVLLLVEKLGAQDIAMRDNKTGEVICPAYAMGHSHAGNYYGVEEIEHLRIAHGIDVSGLLDLRGDERTIAVANAHGPLHGPRSAHMAHAGFPHRHVPEDHSFL